MSNETTNPVLQVKGLKHAIKGAEILKGIDFEVNKGDVVALTGFAGCGKTTLLRALPLLFVPDAGEIHFDGNLIFKN
jgi:ABC-type transporter Mla maintaining outer membrane lipid asymmetry ATPase subunit MlaF